MEFGVPVIEPDGDLAALAFDFVAAFSLVSSFARPFFAGPVAGPFCGRLALAAGRRWAAALVAILGFAFALALAARLGATFRAVFF